MLFLASHQQHTLGKTMQEVVINRVTPAGAARWRTVILGLAMLLGCAAVAMLVQSDPPSPHAGPSVLGLQSAMEGLRRQKEGMSPDQMFVTATQAGLLAANDAGRFSAAAPTSALAAARTSRVAVQGPTQRLEEMETESEPEAEVGEPESEAATAAPLAEVQEGGEAALPPAGTVAQEAADATVPEAVKEGQEQIADDAVPDVASAPSSGIPAGYHLVAASPQRPPMNVVFQGSSFQVPVQSPGVGLVENAVNMPPALFQGGGWSEETMNGLPTAKQITVAEHKPVSDTQEAPSDTEEQPSLDENMAEGETEVKVTGTGMQEPEAMSAPTNEGAEPGLRSKGPIPTGMGLATPVVAVARAPEMGQVMPAVGYSAVTSYCAMGKRQSPINIEFNIVSKVMPLLLWQVTSGATATFRTVPVTIDKEVSGRALLLAGAEAIMPIGGVGYALESVHLHAASEHTIASQRYDMEMQFLHSAIVDGVKKFMVVSVLGRVTAESSPILAHLASALPTEFTTAEVTVPLNLAEMASAVLGQTEFVSPTATNAQSFYQYQGSFTTAPCTENVDWIVLKNPLPVSAGDLEIMAKYLAQPSRPIQPLNNRIVFSRALA